MVICIFNFAFGVILKLVSLEKETNRVQRHVFKNNAYIPNRYMSHQVQMRHKLLHIPEVFVHTPSAEYHHQLSESGARTDYQVRID